MCLSPITFRNRGHVVTVPCGKCLECVSKYQNDWKFRITAECENYRYCYFITLTYDNYHLTYTFPSSVTSDLRDAVGDIPSTAEKMRAIHQGYGDYLVSSTLSVDTLIPVVSKRDVQLWIKAFRERLRRDGYSVDFKYFLCSEYGPKTLRPHYHAIFMTNYPLKIFTDYVVNSWSMGNVDWKKRALVPYGNRGMIDVCRYVSKYCCKPSGFENPYVVHGIAPKCFRLMSKGIGLSRREEIVKWFRESCPFKGRKFGFFHSYNFYYIQWLYNFAKIYENGYLYSMPRYWRDALFPHRTYVGRSLKYDKRKGTYSIVSVKTKRRDPYSPLAIAYKEYCQVEYINSIFFDNLLGSALSVLDSENFFRVAETLSLLDAKTYADSFSRSLTARFTSKLASFRNFYSKSVA